MPVLPSLVFQNTTFTVIDRNGEPWLKASEIAQALGYARVDSIARIYDRNADEFTDQMTQIIHVGGDSNSLNLGNVNLTVAKNNNLGNSDALRIFSMRGAHLIAMFARTAVAKAFRVWVLDIIDHHLGRLTVEPTPAKAEEWITREQLDKIARLVHGISLCCHHQDAASYAVYAGVREQYNIDNIHKLPAIHFESVYGMIHVLYEKAQDYLKLRCHADQQFIKAVLKRHQFQMQMQQNMFFPK
ncbi:MAG: hypothetical protein J0649_09125 [Methylococcales bacterium]|jgi:prophage antirepressor-like protein|nr:hypothetical protein [Methylococcales bacterium]